MHLIYINELGLDYKQQKQYEFIFSESTEINMEDWFKVPASSCVNSQAPDMEYVDLVGLLKDTEIILEMIQNSDYFGVIDAVDGIIALAWEKSNFEDGMDRIYFKFGESLDSVNKKLKERKLHLIRQEIKFKQQ